MILTRQPEGEVIAVMVVWNGISFLQKALESIYQVLRPEDDLLIVDNGSTDGSYEYINFFFPHAAVLQTGKNLGGAGGFNAGTKVALTSDLCKFIWLLDNDIYLDHNSLMPLINTLLQNSNAAAAGSQICMYYQPNIVQEVGARYGPWLGSINCYYHNKPQISKAKLPYEVDYLAACSLLICADVVKKYGLFKDFFIFYDDVEWGLRINAAGLKCLAVPESVIYHNFSGIKPVIAWREYYRKRNRCVCLLLYPPKKGGYFSLWINLIALSYRASFFYWSKDFGLHYAYSQARKDFLLGKLGKQIEAVPISELRVPVISGFNDYFLDISSLGNAIFLIDKIRNVKPLAKIYGSLELKSELESKGFHIQLANSRNKKSTISILDSYCSIYSILEGASIYQLTSEGILPNDSPYLNYCRIFFGRFLGSLSGIIVGSCDIFSAISNRKKYFK
jgi:GT2 family glycosyltransferase